MSLVMVEAPPSRALAPYVTRLAAYREDYGEPVARSEMAMPGVVLVLGLGGPMEVNGVRMTSFTGGLGDRFAATRVTGASEGVEVFLTPFGARRLFGMPMRELANLMVPVTDVLGAWGLELLERVGEIDDWGVRLAVTDTLLACRIRRSPEVGPEIAWAWGELLGSGGAVSSRVLAEGLGWSHRHLVSRFHDQVGLAPKAVGRVIRFGRAVRLLQQGRPIADAALKCGYYDQAHMNREFRTLGDTTPGQIYPRPQVSGLAH
ncbi:helix-turn-helix domain-containing protein [Nonomuraea sp. NPDC050536]|uniref:helix-turn-helix domain-containing protein n=1 Tax=Nonomuraea sp. NPDC050536 TaxID=3364366 RepID=UPI0037CCB3EB